MKKHIHDYELTPLNVILVVTISVLIQQPEDRRSSRLPEISGPELPHLCISIGRKIDPWG